MSDATTLADLIPDPQNARQHNPRNIGMIAESLQRFGANRGIVIDEHGTVLAGNGVLEAAGQAGMDAVRVIPVDGSEIVAIQVSHLTDEQKRQYAVADNRTTDLSTWDAEELQRLIEEDSVDLSAFFFEDELERFLSDMPSGDEWGDAFGSLPDGDRDPFQQMTFTLADEQAAQVNAALAAAKALGPFTDTGNENSNGNALARICETFLTEHG